MRSPPLFAVTSVLIAAACGSSTSGTSASPSPSASPDAGAPPPTTPDGAVEASSPNGDADGSADAGDTLFDGELLIRGLIEGTAFGVFVRQTSFVASLPALGDGHCDVRPRDEGDNFIPRFQIDPNATYVSLGPSVKIASAAGTLTATPDGPQAWYGAATTTFFSFGADVTFATDGDANGLPAASLGPFEIPSQVTPIPDSVDGTVTLDGGPVKIHYGGGTGAQSFHIFITSKTNDIDCYPSPLSTEFELPQAVVAVLDHSFVPLVWAESRFVGSLAGRRVLVRVTSDNLD